MPDFQAMLDALAVARPLTLDWKLEDAPSLAIRSELTYTGHFYRVLAQKQQDGTFCFVTEQFLQNRKPQKSAQEMNPATNSFSSGGYKLFPDAVQWCELHEAAERQ